MSACSLAIISPIFFKYEKMDWRGLGEASAQSWVHLGDETKARASGISVAYSVD
jgi:hypothetical protein